jgi:hypothetical protein
LTGLYYGCSGCVHGKYDACEWITVEEIDLCAPLGYYEAIVNYLSATLGSSTNNIKALLNNELQKLSDNCPADPTKEPQLRSHGLNIAIAAISYSHAFTSDWCEFPREPWVVDRTAFTSSLLGGEGEFPVKYNTTKVPYAQQVCTAANTPILQEPTGAIVIRSSPMNNFDMKSIIKTYTNTGLPPGIVGVVQMAECARLLQSVYCNQYCPEYGVDSGIVTCRKDMLRFVRTCGNTFGFPFNNEFIISEELLLQLNQIVGGISVKCIDYEKVTASSKFMLEKHFSDPCVTLGKPYVDRCESSCIVTYWDEKNCGKCGKKCKITEWCNAGVCELDV